MTACSTAIFPPYDPALGVTCIGARRELVKRFNGFKLRRKIGLSDEAVGNLYRWLRNPGFNRTCEDAGVDCRVIEAIFERQLALGCEDETNFAMNLSTGTARDGFPRH